MRCGLPSWKIVPASCNHNWSFIYAMMQTPFFCLQFRPNWKQHLCVCGRLCVGCVHCGGQNPIRNCFTKCAEDMCTHWINGIRARRTLAIYFTMCSEYILAQSDRGRAELESMLILQFCKIRRRSWRIVLLLLFVYRASACGYARLQLPPGQKKWSQSNKSKNHPMKLCGI